MRSKLLTASMVLATLGIAACGSSSSSSSTTTPSAKSSTKSAAPAASSAQGTNGKTAAVASRTYSVKLTGKAETPAGPPSGTGSAVITVHGKTDQVCWRFAHLKGFTTPKVSHIHSGATGVSGPIVAPLGSLYKAKGCVPASATLLKAIEKNPHAFYVNIHNTKYPGGAVRAQL